MKKNILIISLFAVIIAVGLVFIINTSKKSAPFKPAPTKPKAVIAFVIDDWGYNKNHLDLLLEIQRPITISILPNLHYSRYVADFVRKNCKLYDIILHLPLESKTNSSAELDTIRGNMDDSEILSILKKDIESIGEVIGVSNHQGSKATEDKRVMRVILTELKKRNLLFTDSLTTSKSVCPKIADDIGLKYIRRDVFLDITDETDTENFDAYVKGQLLKLTRVAIQKGKAVGIGHNIKSTLRIIKDTIPELEKQGIKIVPLKELVSEI